MTHNLDQTKGLRTLWIASAWLFVIAAGAGVAFRWGMMSGFPEGLRPDYLRHGHSHLMLMGWATPALMALMAARWPAQGGRPRHRSVCIVGWSAWVLALVSFPAFILWGYESVAIGSANLPVAAILSGFAIFSWYAFAVVYFRAHRGISRTPTLKLWDIAVASLVISSFGAWAVAGLMMGGVDSILWEVATVHFFVELFGAGWLVLGALGLLRSVVDTKDSTNERFGRILITMSVAFVFLVGLPRAYAPELLPLLGSAAAGLLAAGLALIIHSLWPRLDLWCRRVVYFLILNALMLATIAVPPLADWGLGAGLRLLYLHLAFAGFVTLALVIIAAVQWGPGTAGSRSAWLAAVLVLLATLVPMTGLWPSQFGGSWVLSLAFFGSLFATLAATGACLASLRE